MGSASGIIQGVFIFHILIISSFKSIHLEFLGDGVVKVVTVRNL